MRPAAQSVLAATGTVTPSGTQTPFRQLSSDFHDAKYRGILSRIGIPPEMSA